jgi:hypothetical protein
VVGRLRDESVDLIYLDPPFNSKASYNVLFKAPTGEPSQAQIEAFEDTVRLAMPEIGLFDAISSVSTRPSRSPFLLPSWSAR